ncbi:DUF881 domain-containing protein [Anaerovorax odorimutans]|uniref:DUF881 domain-containing protein n=1 Tax=Anaerovorax odorimutans TaxID=109327 RepID=UPI000409504A|nr:DUF881 domain-containing protein [Anaerovorax odorimutans]
MKKKSGVIIVGLLALCIGLVISIQISTTKSSEIGGLVPVSKLKVYETELTKLRAEKEDALSELMELENRMDQIEKDKANEDYFLKGIVTDLEKYKMLAGVVDVKGPGVIITIDDPVPEEGLIEERSTIMDNYQLLLELVNKLKDAGSEAISINDQRIISTTEISLAGNNVNINGVPTAPPYIIKAIGNPNTIESAITIKYGIVYEMVRKDRYALQVDIDKKDEIEIPRFSGVIKFRYAASAEDSAEKTE